MDELLQFLTACVDEDEATAGEWHAVECAIFLVQCEEYGVLTYWPCDCGADRQVREVQAKRAILAGHRTNRYGDCETCSPDSCGCCSGPYGICPTLKATAAIYSDRPGYREEWQV